MIATSWSKKNLKDRLLIVKKARHRIAEMTDSIAEAISLELSRNVADTLAAEIFPLLAACQFLEKEAERILKPRKLGRRGLPFWLSGVESEVQRTPFGRVLIIGPANYPLLLAGVQAVQALTAGNTVVWKPGRGGRPVADLFARAFYDSGLPAEALRVTDESIEAIDRELFAGVDKVFLTGSVGTGRIILAKLASSLTPCVAELSGCDGVVVLPSADLKKVVKALLFGLRLNGSATCMAPRRVLLVNTSLARRSQFLEMLKDGMRPLPAVRLPAGVRGEISALLEDAKQKGGLLVGETADDKEMRPILIDRASTEMKITQTDIFAPVLAVIDVADENAVLSAQEACPFGLTCSIFGETAAAKQLASKLKVGFVLINDLIVPTADPRVPFGGRRMSGFGTTRGREGLLEMTAIRTVATRRSASSRHYEATGERHADLFKAAILVSHSERLTKRISKVRELVKAVRRMKIQDVHKKSLGQRTP